MIKNHEIVKIQLVHSESVQCDSVNGCRPVLRLSDSLLRQPLGFKHLIYLWHDSFSIKQSVTAGSKISTMQCPESYLILLFFIR